MLRLVILAVAVVGCLANPILKECHPSGNSAVVISNARITPYPPKLPGNVKISLDVEIKTPLDKFDFNATIIKDLDGFPVKIPCVEGLGSCYYNDACSLLSELFPDGKCPEGVTQCTCPFKPNKVQISNLEITLPALPDEIAPIAAGKYEFILALHDSSNKAVISCVNIKLELATN